MKKNMGTYDRIIRTIIGISILFYIQSGNVIGETTGTVVLFILAIILIVTSIFSICLCYMPFGISTCPVKHPKKR